MSISLTDSLIRGRTTGQSYARGEDYYYAKAIFDTVQRGSVLEGYCEANSQPQPYYVRVTFDGDRITETSCTCQYDYGGDCKHVVALLLTYLYRPQVFEVKIPLDETLRERDKDDLVKLVVRMVERYPDLQTLVDLPTPSARRNPVDAAPFRQQIRRALETYDDEWGSHKTSKTVLSIVNAAEDFAASGDRRSASAIYRAILDECFSDEFYPLPHYDDDFYVAVDEAVDALAVLLDYPEMTDDDEQRRLILETLLLIYTSENDISNYDIGYDAPEYLLQYARQPDLAFIRAGVEAAKRRAMEKPYSTHMAQTYTDFLTEIDLLDNVDPEVILNRLREEGMYSLLVGKLIEMQRTDEAAAVIREHLTQPQERLREVARLNNAGRTNLAVELAEETLQQQFDERLCEWLLTRLNERGDRQETLHWQRVQMQHAPTIEHYTQLKSAAESLGQWEAIYPEVVNDMERNRHYDVLTEVYLHDQAWALAWETLPKVSKSLYFYDQPLELKVAEQAGFADPKRALAIYKKYVDTHIAQRNRDDYREAAYYLAAMRELYLRLDDEASWEALINQIKQEFKQLRALQDELRKAGI